MTLGFLVELNKAEYESQIAILQLISYMRYPAVSVAAYHLGTFFKSHASNA
jgi:hypothetical protein